jgi:hypothetical protein
MNVREINTCEFHVTIKNNKPKHMKKVLIVVAIITFLNACSKSSEGGTTTPVAETNIAFSINATDNSIAVGASFPVTVTLTSAMPSTSGIKIEATVVDQTNTQNVTQNAAVTSTAATNTVTLINLPKGRWCMATIKVSSVKTSTNNASKSFTVSNK